MSWRGGVFRRGARGQPRAKVVQWAEVAGRTSRPRGVSVVLWRQGRGGNPSEEASRGCATFFRCRVGDSVIGQSCHRFSDVGEDAVPVV